MIPPQSAGTPSLIPHLDLLSSSPPTHFDLTDGTTQPSFDLLVVVSLVCMPSRPHPLARLLHLEPSLSLIDVVSPCRDAEGDPSRPIYHATSSSLGSKAGRMAARLSRVRSRRLRPYLLPSELMLINTISWRTGGSTIGAVASLVERYPESFEGFNLDLGVDENDSKETVGVGRDGGGKCAGKVWESIK